MATRGMERNLLEHTDTEINTHREFSCADSSVCSIHNRTDHRMRKFPQSWRSDRALMERICHHGIGHPDPDHMHTARILFGKIASESIGVHGCCGCCA